MRALVALCAVLAPLPVAASDPEDVDGAYFYDGGAVPFFWVPVAASAALLPLLPPREQPFGFSPFEGGAPRASWEVPSWVIVGLGAGAITGMVSSEDASRFYHAKGLAQSMATSALVTSVLKYTFSRRRPHWHDKDPERDSRRSFPSGHATQAFAIGTYTALWLRGQVLTDAHWGYQALTYGGLALASTAFAAERVVHNRHHLGDVIVGSLIGSVSSVAFYRYQQDRFEAVDRGGVFRAAPMLSLSGGW